jgi:hypothetical protein
MTNTGYEQRSLQQIEAAKKQATFMFVGGGTPTSYKTVAFKGSYFRNSNQRIVGELSNTTEQVATYAWSDYRNWVKLIDGEPQPPEPVTYGNRNSFFPSASDHVIITAPVSVAGNYRTPIAFKQVQIGLQTEYVEDFSQGPWGDLYTPKYYSYTNIATGEPLNGFAYEPPQPTEEEDENFVVGPWLHGFGYDSKVPVCASATFLNDSFIIVERFNSDYEASLGFRSEFVEINFPCTFYGSSFISPRIGEFSVSNFSANGISQPDMNLDAGRPAYLKFNQPLSFYDNSQIKMYEGPVHYSMEGVNTQVIPNGFIGGLSLNCNIHFYGDRQINLFFNNTSETKKVYFHDETRFSGGMITNAVFNDSSKRPAGVQTQEEQFAPYARGPHITNKAEFNDKSVNQFPLFCAADFNDQSLCTSPFFNNTNFYGESIYEWFSFWSPTPNNESNFNNTFWTQGIILPSFEGKTTTFSGDSTNFGSKVLTTAPTRFEGGAKLVIPYRFQDGNGFLPSNFEGEFISSTTDSVTDAGNGTDYSSYSDHNFLTDTHFYCSHAHFKSGNRVALTPNESPISAHIHAGPPLIYAEFNNYTGDKDWGNPLNWTRIGGRSSSIPDAGTIVRVKSDVEINNGVAARCAGLIIDAGKSVKIDFMFIVVFMNYGTFSGTVLEVGTLFMMDNSKNIGRISQATTTIFTENATNNDSFLNLDGFIRTGGLLVIPPRPNNLSIGGTLQAPPPVLSSWSSLDYLFTSGAEKPTPEHVFYNDRYHCFGDFLYQTQ